MKALTALLAAMLLASCGGGDGGDDAGGGGGSGPSGGSSLPACESVWKAGATLPDDYDGCTQPSGTMEAAAAFDCTDGGRLVTYQDRMFATLGGKITEAGSDSQAYRKAYETCHG